MNNFRSSISLLAMGAILASGSTFAGTDNMAGKRDSAPEWTDADTNRDGYLSKDELVPYPTLGQDFDRIDTDHDGKLSRAEFGAWLDMDHEARTNDRH